MVDTLGSEEVTKTKWLFLILSSLFVFGLFFYAYPGASVAEQSLLNYYILMMIVSVIFIIVDFYFKNEKYLDTVTIEEHPDWLSPKIQIIIGIVLSGLIGYVIWTTGMAFVLPPPFSMFENPLGNAILVATVGIVETFFFFALLYPSLYTIINSHIDTFLISWPVSMAITGLVFFGFHTWVYAYSEMSLYSVFVFGLINCLTVTFTRSNIINAQIHFSNNFFVQFFRITRTFFMVFL